MRSGGEIQSDRPIYHGKLKDVVDDDDVDEDYVDEDDDDDDRPIYYGKLKDVVDEEDDDDDDYDKPIYHGKLKDVDEDDDDDYNQVEGSRWLSRAGDNLQNFCVSKIFTKGALVTFCHPPL